MSNTIIRDCPPFIYDQVGKVNFLVDTVTVRVCLRASFACLDSFHSLADRHVRLVPFLCIWFRVTYRVSCSLYLCKKYKYLLATMKSQNKVIFSWPSYLGSSCFDLFRASPEIPLVFLLLPYFPSLRDTIALFILAMCPNVMIFYYEKMHRGEIFAKGIARILQEKKRR